MRLRIAFLGLLLSSPFAVGQPDKPPKTDLPPAKASAPTPLVAPSLAEPDGVPVSIDLASALRLSTTSNLDVAQARAVVEQASAARQRAVSRMLPNVGLGVTYVDHAGRIQQANGNILNVNRTSLAVGVTPTLTFDVADAIFLPLAARQVEEATRAGMVRVTNDTLLAIAEAYIAVLRGQRRLARIDLTLSFLSDDKPSAFRGGAKGLAQLVRDVVEAGGKEAFKSDLARVQVEMLRRNEERAIVLQELETASAELARLLRLDPRTRFRPVEEKWGVVPLPGTEWLLQDVEVLMAFALGNRPELAEFDALVRATGERERGARYRPYLPQVQVAYFDGGFGGGPTRNTSRNIVQDVHGAINTPITPTGEIARFGHRSDLSVTVGWQLQGMGFGNAAERREAAAVNTQAKLRLLAAHDRVKAQVVTTRAAVTRNNERLWTAWQAISDKDGKPAGPVFESLRLNFERIRGGEGRPLEALDSIRGLNDTFEAFANGLSEYDRARFRLLVVLGVPSAALYDPARMPAPPTAQVSPVVGQPASR